jgi:cell division transport system ATP-binding protein
MSIDKVIMAQQLSLGYENSETIISRATFEINAGDFVFITGASGSGKSTLLKSFYGEISVDQGNLIVGGVNMNDISSSKKNLLRQNLGIVFQDYKLVKEWSIEKNVMLPLLIAGFAKDVSEAQVDKLLTHVKLTHQAGKYPYELSGGEQQRVAMARALSHNPTIILADEPTGNLDDYSSRVIWNLLEGTKEQLGTTIIVVTHNIPTHMNVHYRHFHLEYGSLHEVT